MTLSKNDVRSKHIQNGEVKKRDIAEGAVDASKVEDGTLLSGDFKPGELVAGAPGPQGLTGSQGLKGDTGLQGLKGDTGLQGLKGDTGPQGLKGDTGPQGLKGDTGTVDTANFYDKAQSDAIFLPAAGKAADADLLDGLNATDFLGAMAKAADADLLDGLNATDFLATTAKAADADHFDGLDSERFARFAGRVAFNGTIIGGSGFTVSKPNPGVYVVTFPEGTYSGCHRPIVTATTNERNARFVFVTALSCGAAGNASFTVTILDRDGLTALDTAFSFVGV